MGDIQMKVKDMLNTFVFHDPSQSLRYPTLCPLVRPSVYLFVRLYLRLSIYPTCPHVPPATISIRLLDFMPVPSVKYVRLPDCLPIFCLTVIGVRDGGTPPPP